MSFAAIRNTATSALATSQVNMQIAASNIANADTAGYTRKIGSQVMTSTGGLGAGVQVTSITGTADKYLLKSLNTATSELASASALKQFADRVQALFGTIDNDGSSNTLANHVAKFESALAQLAGTPESQTLQVQLVDALDTLVGSLRSISTGTQSLRASADQGIADGVNLVNQRLEAINTLNKNIKQAAARGDMTADMEDQRALALQDIATELNVSAYVGPDNVMKIYTASGSALLDGTVHKINYAPSAFVTTETVFNPIMVDGKDITSAITAGKMGAQIHQRDVNLPATQAEIDVFAQTLIESVNGAYNQGTRLPAPSSVTSATTVVGTDALNGTGTFRLAEINSDGTLVSYSDFDLATYADYNAFAAAINAVPGFDASIDANGNFAISSTSGNGIALADISSELSGKGVSASFGFNNLLVGTDARGIAVRADLLAAPTGLATASLDKTDPLVVGAPVVGVSPAVAKALQNSVTAATDFPAAGGLAATSSSFASFAGLIASRAAITSDTAGNTLQSKQSTYETLTTAISAQSGVNVDEEVARVTELEQQYSTAAQLLRILNEMFDTLLGTVK
jgi:flagellar hook-associated protein 1 FlgK